MIEVVSDVGLARHRAEVLGRRDPRRAGAPTEIDVAVRAALAVHYFPGMWEWERAIVGPLSRGALGRSLSDLRERGGATSTELGGMNLLALGEDVLDHYAAWAAQADDFVPLQAEFEIDAAVPDPDVPGQDLANLSGQPVHFRARVPLSLRTPDGSVWLAQYRVGNDWEELSVHLRDEHARCLAWGWERDLMDRRIAGTVHVELLAVAPAWDAVLSGATLATTTDEPAPGVRREQSRWFRRTWVVRDPIERHRAGMRLAADVRDAVQAGLCLDDEDTDLPPPLMTGGLW